MATEREQIRHVVLGIGINVNQAAFPGELQGRATSLQLLCGPSTRPLPGCWRRGRSPSKPPTTSFCATVALAAWRAGGCWQRCPGPAGSRAREERCSWERRSTSTPTGALLLRTNRED
jgi:hypothetical protein